LATVQIVREFEKKGYKNAADEAVKAIRAYHNIVQKKEKNTFNKDYNEAFACIDKAIKDMANQVFYNHENKSFDIAYAAFADFDYISAVLERKHFKVNKETESA